MKRLIEIGGWIGVCFIVGSFAAVNFGVMETNSVAYPVFNLLGPLFVGVDAYVKKNYQPVALQIIWFIVAIVALARLLF